MIFFGASGHGKVVMESWLASGGTVTGAFDDDPSVTKIFEIPVGHPCTSSVPENSEIFVSIGDNRNRKKIVEKIKGRFGKVIHPRTVVSRSATIGEGAVLMPGVIINACVTVAKHVIINTAASVDHDCKVADFVHIAPNVTLCGGVTVLEGALIGAGATVIPNITIGKWAVVAAGSVVTKNVPDFAMVAGIPARVIRINQ